jgi:lysophospholipase L1-like esterase
MKIRLNVILALFGWMAVTSNVNGAEYFIHDGDRVVFLGDSITEQRLFTTYIEAYSLTRYPAWNLTFRNVGWGGDTSWLRKRSHKDEKPFEKELFAADAATQQQMVEEVIGNGLGRDVLPLKPTVVTVDFGMNDHNYQSFREDIFRAYIRSQAQTAKVLEANGARVVLLTPQPMEQLRPDPNNDVDNQSLGKFSDGLRVLSIIENTAFMDQFDPYMTIMMREHPTNPAVRIGGGDAVHPGPTGHTLMAWIILKGLGAPALVSRAEIASDSQKVTGTQCCRVENLQTTNGILSFDRLDEALPMPIDPRAQSALKLAPILDELDQYELQVTGLAAGDYEVSIDGEVVAKMSADTLASGCNLATTAGPITRQSQAVMDLVFAKNNLFYKRWRNAIRTVNGTADETTRNDEVISLDKQIAEAEAKINAVRQPVSHHFELKRAGQTINAENLEPSVK